MILFPAVDIQGGRCVRLTQGRKEAVTVFDDDPVAQAKRWVAVGAEWLHIIDLDGAFSGRPRNAALITRICTTAGVPVQLGGGIRDLATATAYLEAGVRRLIIGTIALTEPDTFAAICAAYPGRIGVSLDVRDGHLKAKGWVEDAGLTVDDVLPRILDAGAAFIVYTDISRDGMQTGVNLEAMRSLCRASTVPVLAAGGVTTLDDIKSLWSLSTDGLEGVIIGKAMYTGTLDVSQALAWIRTQG